MFVLDTNHLRELSLRTAAGEQLQRRMEQVDAATTVVCAEEIQRGWLALLSRARQPDEEALAYAQFAESIHFLATLALLPWDVEAAARFRAFRRAGVRIGSMGSQDCLHHAGARCCTADSEYRGFCQSVGIAH